MVCLCEYAVLNDAGPWRAGWWLVWDMTNPVAAIVAFRERSADHIIGAWGPEYVPVLLEALYVHRALGLRYVSPTVAATSMENLTAATDFEQTGLRRSS